MRYLTGAVGYVKMQNKFSIMKSEDFYVKHCGKRGYCQLNRGRAELAGMSWRIRLGVCPVIGSRAVGVSALHGA